MFGDKVKESFQPEHSIDQRRLEHSIPSKDNDRADRIRRQKIQKLTDRANVLVVLPNRILESELALYSTCVQ